MNNIESKSYKTFIEKCVDEELPLKPGRVIYDMMYEHINLGRETSDRFTKVYEFLGMTEEEFDGLQDGKFDLFDIICNYKEHENCMIKE